jgi:hypothetical protein
VRQVEQLQKQAEAEERKEQALSAVAAILQEALQSGGQPREVWDEADATVSTYVDTLERFAANTLQSPADDALFEVCHYSLLTPLLPCEHTLHIS